MRIVKDIGGSKFRFVRRRYGNQTFTWVEVEVDGTFVSLGDPWPCVVPKRSELIAAASCVTKGAA